jgi:hypothetical protein
MDWMNVDLVSAAAALAVFGATLEFFSTASTPI